jgi:hypothetical protein
MIPLSLLPFVALSSIKDPTSTQIIILPFTGWLLISTWFVIAQNHRAFQQNSEQRMKEIEDIWGFKKGFEGKRVPARWDNDRIKAVRNRLERVMVIPGMVLYMRYALWGIVTVLTLLVILFWPR